MSNRKRANSFDFARLVGAMLVLYSHAFALAGAPEPSIAGWSFGSWGVFIFFSISGYLISMSWLSDPHLLRFGIRRALRILPALTVVILLSCFALGPLVTTLPTSRYFEHPDTYRYMENILLYVHYALPGCFDKNFVPFAVNGSLWSLPPEVLMYVLLAGLGLLTLLRQRTFMLCFGAAIALADVYLLRTTPLIVPIFHCTIPPYTARVPFLGMELHQVMMVAPYFWAGCLLFLFRDQIRYSLNVAVFVVLILACLPAGGWWTLASIAGVPYLALAFCTQQDHPFALPRWLGDISYGVYIYAFPIQQTVYLYGHSKYSILQMTLLGAIFILIGGFLSWHIIENPALRLKPAQRKAKTA